MLLYLMYGKFAGTAETCDLFPFVYYEPRALGHIHLHAPPASVNTVLLLHDCTAVEVVVYTTSSYRTRIIVRLLLQSSLLLSCT